MVSLTLSMQPRASPNTRATAVARKDHQRRDIQGLRAVAVVAVILDHLVHWPVGGFVGVDVFFVISGFMITGQLLREHERTGRISFVGFYRRRLRRLFPASVLVLACTVGAASLLFSFSRFVQTAGDAVAALFFAGNWRMATQGTDYFQSSAPPSPLQHFWSLGVEEQFYLVWPALMVAVIFVAGVSSRRDARRTRTAVAVAIAALTAASFWQAVVGTAADPSWAYFSTFSRAWELGVGALIAVTAKIYRGIPDLARPMLAWIGVGGIIASLFVISPDRSFPGPWAAFPVIASALVIISNEGGQQRWIAPLTNPFAVYLGDLSYSLYLWHFPLIIFVGTLIETRSASVQLILAGVILLVSAYSYHLLEDPIRRSTWLEPRPRLNQDGLSHVHARRGRGPDRGGSGTSVTSAYRLTALSLAVLVTAGLVTAAVHKSTAGVGEGVPAAAVPAASASRPTKAPSYGPEVTRLQEQMTAALASSTWPKDLSPSMDDAIRQKTRMSADVAACAKIQPISVDDCTWGSPSAKKTAVIVGDSVAVTYVGALRAAMVDKGGWKLRSYATFGCTFTKVDVGSTDPDVAAGCPAKKEEAVRGIRDLKPDVVFVTNTYEPRGNLTTSELGRSTRALVDTFRTSTKQVIFLSPPPSDIDIQECYSRVSKPGRCVSRITPQWLSVAQTEQDTASAIKGRWIDSRPFFCVAGACPSFAGRIPTKFDKVHMTPEYALQIAPALAEILASDKILS